MQESLNLENIKQSILSAISLLDNEISNIEFDILKNEYLFVIEQLKEAVNEIEKNE